MTMMKDDGIPVDESNMGMMMFHPKSVIGKLIANKICDNVWPYFESAVDKLKIIDEVEKHEEAGGSPTEGLR